MNRNLSPDVAAALNRLNQLLPLQERQNRLGPSLRGLHIAILRAFARRGAPPAREEMAQRVGLAGLDAALRRLADDDLIVLSPDKIAITGAYPFTSESRAHRVAIDGHEVHAMCALDALAVAPLFGVETRVRSRCHISAAPIEIHMRGSEVLAATPAHPFVGIRWQGTSGCAAQSLCLEMVFLADRATALSWRQNDADISDVFSLPDAVTFGAAFFLPLLADAD